MKIFIAGYGAEGRSNLAYYRQKFPDAELAILDENPVTNAPENVKIYSGADVFSHFYNDGDLILRSPGISPTKLRTTGKVWTAANEFFERCPAPIIGVTGTKGKGTTCSLIASILKAAGKTVHLVGNIGVPPLDVLSQIQPSDIVVYELSSFQLWDLQRSPHVAVVLMIEPDHQDVHRTFDEYVEAKANICHHQQPEDFCVYHPTNPYARQIALSSSGQGQAYRYAIADDFQVYVSGVYFMSQNRQICPTDALQLPGVHNLENACAAMSAVSLAVPGIAPEAYDRGLRTFDGLPHRLKFVRKVNEISYYDDSIATTPGSAIAALNAFSRPCTIILGGSDKGADYKLIVERCSQLDVRVVAVGQTGEKIAELCRQQNVKFVRELGEMPQVVAAATQLSRPGEVVILSPASASFDQYKSYCDRGEKFIAAVEDL